MSRLSLVLVILFAGCASYDPPVSGDRASPKFQTDLARCRKQAATVAAKKANATPQSAFMAAFESGDQERRDLVTCMQGRGYASRP